MKQTVLSVALALTFSFATAQEGKYKKIDSLLTFLSDNNKFMGALSIAENGKTVFEKGYGFADIDGNIKATPATKYKIGSITKMFTAATIFKLVEDKKLTLDTKLSKFFPKVKNANKITIDNLLNHSTGIYNYTNADDFMMYAMMPTTNAEMLKRIEGFESVFEPGSQNEYSNSNYLLLGYIIEKITKKTYFEAINDVVLKKAGLTSVSLFDKVDPKTNEAYSYMFAVEKERIPEWSATVAYSAGALQATMGDLDKFITALFEGKIISKESVAKMTQMQNRFGRGTFPMDFYDKKFIGHSGHIENFTSLVGYNPDNGLSIALVTNGGDYELNDVLIGIKSYYYGMDYDFPNLNKVKVDEKILEGYTGTYATPSIPVKIAIMYEHGTLLAQASGQSAFPLDPVSDSVFKFDAAGIKITFKQNAFVISQHGSDNEFTKE